MGVNGYDNAGGVIQKYFTAIHDIEASSAIQTNRPVVSMTGLVDFRIFLS
jgi:hypothetical protein